MERLPEAQAVLSSFPWGRLESDYTFNVDLAKGRFRVLGGTGMGFWSQRGGTVAHSETGEGFDEYKKLRPQVLRRYDESFKHVDGFDLLRHKGHLTDEEGWRLDKELIPYRDFGKVPEERHPVLVTAFEGGVKDWDSWDRWRKLPKRSPAALLMDYPLSVYQLITRTLGLTRPEDGRPDKRIKLCVHLIGAEVELNYLPLYVSPLSSRRVRSLLARFSEIALLLPYHDISLVLWGQSVHGLAEAGAKTALEGSPAKEASKNGGPIFTYSAPQKLGGGAIKVVLNSDSPIWSFESLHRLTDASPELAPDALVALNAGLGSYRIWMEVVAVAHSLNIPFAVTEYAEQSLEHAVDMQVSSSPGNPSEGGMLTDLQLAMAIRGPPARQHPIALNPFHRPGQRSLPCVKMPNLVNGFTMVVVGVERSPRKPRTLADLD